MKIEKISENQIKFTLNRMDLASRQIKISELAYGTEKTKDLLQDMMEQASDELDFEFNDTPVMIEAIPVSMDCIVLMVTKIDEPDEVDTKFSGFSSLKNLLSDEEEPMRETPPAAVTPEQAEERVCEIFKSRRERGSESVIQRMFSFDSLEDVIDFSHQGADFFRGESSLYSSAEDGKYYLVMKDTQRDMRTFGRICNTALEYGSRESLSHGREAYVNEHFRCIVKKKALQSLADI